MASYRLNSVYLCSIYPLQLGPEKRPFGVDQRSGMHFFTIPPAPKGEYQTLEIPDMWQRRQNFDVLPKDPERWEPVLIDCVQIAQDLVTSWTHNRALGLDGGSGHPGVMLIGGENPTDKELEGLVASQTRYFNARFYEAQKNAQENKFHLIGDEHRAAAAWIGKDQGTTWAKPFDPAVQHTCPLCQSLIHPATIICPHCNMIIGKMPEEFAALNRTNQRLQGHGGKQQPAPQAA